MMPFQSQRCKNWVVVDGALRPTETNTLFTLKKKRQLEHKWKITGLCFLALLPVMPVMCVQLTTALRFSYFRAISSRRFKGQLLLVFVPVMWHICLARASRQMIKELIFMPWLFHWSTKSTATCKRAKGKIKKKDAHILHSWNIFPFASL